ncbi:DUF3180 family protein [Ancrocorticia populi]|uniref:DUF3180 domain-containing protein n=1 Tax=Ancrocorticia populi TaxID=2175228 RepID=A0A2V1K6T4_9ACTO|nr:DUF3180 family protein [Ancrocorticia populi]PWF25982.1 hypothetical protein DD236_07705 [Ancrocorticia populi]
MKAIEHLAWLAAGLLLGVLVGLLVIRRDAPPPFPAPTALIPAGIAIALMVWAWQVRRFKAGKRESVSGVPVVALALSSSRGGVLLLGLFGAVVLAYWTTGSSDYVHSQMLASGAAALASAVLAVCGIIAERWCRL